jgi:hypothetical protein
MAMAMLEVGTHQTLWIGDVSGRAEATIDPTPPPVARALALLAVSIIGDAKGVALAVFGVGASHAVWVAYVAGRTCIATK